MKQSSDDRRPNLMSEQVPSPLTSPIASKPPAGKAAQRQQIEMADRLTKLRERLARDAKVGKAAKAKKDEQDGNVEPPR